VRIVQLNPFHYPYRGGIEHRIHNLSRRLASKHEVIVLTGRLPDTAPYEEIDGYQVHRLDSKLWGRYNPPYIKTPGVLEALMELEADVVDFHYRWAPSYTRAIKAYDGPKIFTFHNGWGEGEGMVGLMSEINDWRFSKVLRGFDRVVCVSEFVKDDLVVRGFDESCLMAAPNGVDIPTSRYVDEEDHILFVGRLVGTKGLPYLLKAMASVETKLLICGSGPELPKLRKLSERYGLDGKVEFLGRVSEEEKERLMRSCKLFVLPSTWESYGIAAAEAMSYGRPVIASRVGGLPEVIGNSGILTPPRNPKALADAINALLHEDAMRERLGKRARELAETYSWDLIAKQMEGIYSSVAEGKAQ
jgi:glycosyltransferase involved in cell wall biosynthesis